MKDFEDLSIDEKLHVSIHRDVRGIANEVCHLLGLDIQKEAMDLIAELVYKKLKIYSTDLEAFAKHAKRSTINSDDVKLLVRRNPCLKSKISALTENVAGPSKDKKKKTTSTIASVKSTSKKTDQSSSKQAVMESKRENSKEVLKESEKMDLTVDLTFEGQ